MRSKNSINVLSLNKDSEEERKDVLNAYVKTKGNLLAMIDMVPLCILDDIDRFKKMAEMAIEAGEVAVRATNFWNSEHSLKSTRRNSLAARRKQRRRRMKWRLQFRIMI